jgi:hypothetical protein
MISLPKGYRLGQNKLLKMSFGEQFLSTKRMKPVFSRAPSLFFYGRKGVDLETTSQAPRGIEGRLHFCSFDGKRTMAKSSESSSKSSQFRELQQNILMGTASDRYAGWIGQIYSGGKYEKGVESFPSW